MKINPNKAPVGEDLKSPNPAYVNLHESIVHSFPASHQGPAPAFSCAQTPETANMAHRPWMTSISAFLRYSSGVKFDHSDGTPSFVFGKEPHSGYMVVFNHFLSVPNPICAETFVLITARWCCFARSDDLHEDPIRVDDCVKVV